MYGQADKCKSLIYSYYYAIFSCSLIYRMNVIILSMPVVEASNLAKLNLKTTQLFLSSRELFLTQLKHWVLMSLFTEKSLERKFFVQRMICTTAKEIVEHYTAVTDQLNDCIHQSHIMLSHMKFLCPCNVNFMKY